MGKKLHKDKKSKTVVPLTGQEREAIASEIRLKISLLDLGNLLEIKRLLIILKLFTDTGREHVEDVDISSLGDRKLQIRLFNNKNKHSSVILKHQ